MRSPRAITVASLNTITNSLDHRPFKAYVLFALVRKEKIICFPRPPQSPKVISLLLQSMGWCGSMSTKQSQSFQDHWKLFLQVLYLQDQVFRTMEATHVLPTAVMDLDTEHKQATFAEVKKWMDMHLSCKYIHDDRRWNHIVLHLVDGR